MYATTIVSCYLKNFMERILLVNCVYGNGSTGKILQSLHHRLQNNGWESFVRYARGPLSADDGVRKLTNERLVQLQALWSRVTGYTYSCSLFTTNILKKEIIKLRPDIVNLHCINANTVNIIGILKFLKKEGIPTVITCHAEFPYTGGCGHALECRKWETGCNSCPQFHNKDSQLPISYFFDRSRHYWDSLKNVYFGFKQLKITGVSPWLVERIKESPFFDSNQVYCTPNGVNTDIFHFQDNSDLRKQLAIPTTGRVYLFVTPNFNDSLKGGKYIMDFAEKIKKSRPNDRVIIIGYNGADKILPSNIIPIHHTSDQRNLVEFYSMADVTLLASSRETFSMVTAESLCCGTPVVGFKAGGPESICNKGHVHFVDYGDIETLYSFATSIEKSEDISSLYIPEFSESNMVSQYEKVYLSFR